MKNKIAITMGDPSGIGPEIILKALFNLDIDLEKICIIGNRKIFAEEEKRTFITLPEHINFIDIPFDISKLQIGKESKYSGELSYLCLEKACKMVLNSEINGIVTAPVSKNAINEAGHNYNGQTEILEKFLGQNNKNKAEMLFATVWGGLKVFLATRHIRLKDVSTMLSAESLIESIKILNTALKEDFYLKSPKIFVCGLNPHSGENGLLGSEEKEIIIPAINKLKSLGIDIKGPFPADTLFAKAAKAYLNNEDLPCDCYVACYHDQGLIPMKVLAMDKAINVTIGLSVLRTSPSHGTAFDIAGKNQANYQSMLESIKLLSNK
ncbi:MAG: 4-hydroxythreonine-4-phosphate dehydrogenase PdxA [Candidatus Gastranaerophilaceae bacterium]